MHGTLDKMPSNMLYEFMTPTGKICMNRTLKGQKVYYDGHCVKPNGLG